MWRIEIVTTFSNSAAGSMPFTTDEPPPYGMALAPIWSHQARMRTTSCSLSGKATASGGLGTERKNMRQASNQALP